MMNDEPCYSCRNVRCAEEVSHPASNLRLHPKGGLVCQDCWDAGDNEHDPREWADLPGFKGHKRLAEERQELLAIAVQGLMHARGRDPDAWQAFAKIHAMQQKGVGQ